MVLGKIRGLTTVENLPDGSREVHLELDEGELPAFANEAATMLFFRDGRAIFSSIMLRGGIILQILALAAIFLLSVFKLWGKRLLS